MPKYLWLFYWNFYYTHCLLVWINALQYRNSIWNNYQGRDEYLNGLTLFSKVNVHCIYLGIMFCLQLLSCSFLWCMHTSRVLHSIGILRVVYSIMAIYILELSALVLSFLRFIVTMCLIITPFMLNENDVVVVVAVVVGVFLVCCCCCFGVVLVSTHIWYWCYWWYCFNYVCNPLQFALPIRYEAVLFDHQHGLCIVCSPSLPDLRPGKTSIICLRFSLKSKTVCEQFSHEIQTNLIWTHNRCMPNS